MGPAKADGYERHFQRYWRKPYDIQTYRTADGRPIKLATYDQAYREFRAYASLGLSDLLPDGGEVIAVVDDFGPDVPFLLVNALCVIVQHNIPLGSRFTVGGVEALRPSFAEFYDKAALYVMPAEGFPEGFDAVLCGPDVGTVYQAVFVSPEEAEYIADKGGAVFEAKVQAQHADVCRLRRSSCV